MEKQAGNQGRQCPCRWWIVGDDGKLEGGSGSRDAGLHATLLDRCRGSPNPMAPPSARHANAAREYSAILPMARKLSCMSTHFCQHGHGSIRVSRAGRRHARRGRCVRRTPTAIPPVGMTLHPLIQMLRCRECGQREDAWACETGRDRRCMAVPAIARNPKSTGAEGNPMGLDGRPVGHVAQCSGES